MRTIGIGSPEAQNLLCLTVRPGKVRRREFGTGAGVLIAMVPGLDGSGDDHWQTRWEQRLGDAAVRFAPSSWVEPDLDDWCRALDRLPAGTPLLLVAHSLGCLAVAHWLTTRHDPSRPDVRGAVLVAPPDSSAAGFPSVAGTFVHNPAGPLSVPGLVIASDDDPYASRAAADRLAAGWGVPLVSVGLAGHINSASGLDDWPAGWNLVTAFRAGLDGG